jgi:hypothetical protein
MGGREGAQANLSPDSEIKSMKKKKNSLIFCPDFAFFPFSCCFLNKYSFLPKVRII